jgi:hypothetical protein
MWRRGKTLEKKPHQVRRGPGIQTRYVPLRCKSARQALGHSAPFGLVKVKSLNSDKVKVEDCINLTVRRIANHLNCPQRKSLFKHFWIPRITPANKAPR